MRARALAKRLETIATDWLVVSSPNKPVEDLAAITTSQPRTLSRLCDKAAVRKTTPNGVIDIAADEILEGDDWAVVEVTRQGALSSAARANSFGPELRVSPKTAPRQSGFQ